MPVELGELLLEENRITGWQLQQARNDQKVNGGTLGRAMVRLGFIKDEEIASIVSRRYGVPHVDLLTVSPEPHVVDVIPSETAWKHRVLPLAIAGKTLTIAMDNPTNVFAMDDIKLMTGYTVEPVVASESALDDLLDRYYGPRRAVESRAQGASSPLPNVAYSEFTDGLAGTAVLDSDAAPVIKLTNVLLVDSLKRGASDIHIEPYEEEFRVRFRIDGILCNVVALPMKLRDPLIARVKIMAKLDIAEKRLPQDGFIRIKMKVEDRSRDFNSRVSVLPTLWGEKIVMRLRNRSKLILDMTTLGFEPQSLERFTNALARAHGLVLLTGPERSGKTNTFYSAIAALNKSDTNIMTVEDPVEFNLPGINQVQIRENTGITFASVLRSFMRQDPDVIVASEIRDRETAEILIKAALGGRLVLAALAPDSSDALGAVQLLVHMGVPPMLLGRALNLVLAQRLVRRICTECKPETQRESSPRERSEPGSQAARVGARCESCNGTGYMGHVGLFEALEISTGLRHLMTTGATVDTIRSKALEEGMITLRMSGLQKVRAGITGIDEVMREVPADPLAVKMIPAQTARNHRVLPVSVSGKTLTVAMADPTDVRAIEDIKVMTGHDVEPVVASETALEDWLDRHYGRRAHRGSVPEAARSTIAAHPRDGSGPREEIDIDVIHKEYHAKFGDPRTRDVFAPRQAMGAADAPLLVKLTIQDSLRRGASDIHIEPYEREFRVRFRIDGVLYNIMALPHDQRDPFVEQLKVMARLDLAERRLSQDGRLNITLTSGDRSRDVDFAVSCLPTLWGERIVMRLLAKTESGSIAARPILDMTRLGFEPHSLERFTAAISRPYGIVLVTGPGGSGKTNTLYSSVAALNTAKTNIMTAEDRVEFTLPGINQVQTRSIGLDPPTVLSSLLRQDADVIVLDEIHGREAAEIGIKAALTGQLVLAALALESSDAAGAAQSLVEMGLRPAALGRTLNLILAQRLVRRICAHCQTASQAEVSPGLPAEFGVEFSDDGSLAERVGSGCESCSGTGYMGHVGLFEAMEISPRLRDLIAAGATVETVRSSALEEGMLTLRMSGLQKVRAGITTMEEVIRETVV